MAQFPPSVTIEQTDCVICNKNDIAILFQREDLATQQPGLFTVVQCKNCGHIYLNPRPTPESIGFYYPQHYQPYNIPHPGDMRSPWGKWLGTYPITRRCRLINNYTKNGKILDIGCSSGQFLGWLDKFGSWQKIGIELDATTAAEAYQRYHFPIIVGTLQATHFPTASFDVVTMWDVIEHLHNPLADLQEINRILKPEAYLIFSTPVSNSLGASLFNKYWVGYEIPRHLHVFSFETLPQLLAKAGFEILDTTVITGSNHAWSDSVNFWAKGKAFSPTIQHYLHTAFSNLAWYIVTAPLFKLFDWLKLTTPFTFICKKTT